MPIVIFCLLTLLSCLLCPGSICFSKVPLKTKCQPAVQQVFASLYNVRREDLVMELGGVFYGFPPEHHEGGKIASQPTGQYLGLMLQSWPVSG